MVIGQSFLPIDSGTIIGASKHYLCPIHKVALNLLRLESGLTFYRCPECKFSKPNKWGTKFFKRRSYGIQQSKHHAESSRS